MMLVPGVPDVTELESSFVYSQSQRVAVCKGAQRSVRVKTTMKSRGQGMEDEKFSPLALLWRGKDGVIWDTPHGAVSESLRRNP